MPAAQLHAGLQRSRLRVECAGQDYAYELTIRLADAPEEAAVARLAVDPQTLGGFALEANSSEPAPGGSRLVLAFRAADNRCVSISQAPLVDGLQPPEEPHETLTLRGHEAYLVTAGAGAESTLTWADDGLLITVSGKLERVELLRIAAGLHR